MTLLYVCMYVVMDIYSQINVYKCRMQLFCSYKYFDVLIYLCFDWF